MKGKGKGTEQTKVLECYGWFGKGHPQRLYPTPPGFAGKPGAETCSNCKGKGHNSSQCTSKGGGKHEQQAGKGKGKDGGGKGWGKGFGGQGGKGSGKGWSKGSPSSPGWLPQPHPRAILGLPGRALRSGLQVA